jgi:hypothetical protein
VICCVGIFLHATIVKYDKQDQQGKAAFNERKPPHDQATITSGKEQRSFRTHQLYCWTKTACSLNLSFDVLSVICRLYVQTQSNRVCNFHVSLLFLMIPNDHFFQIIITPYPLLKIHFV